MMLQAFSLTGKEGSFRYYWIHEGKAISPPFSSKKWAELWLLEYKEANEQR